MEETPPDIEKKTLKNVGRREAGIPWTHGCGLVEPKSKRAGRKVREYPGKRHARRGSGRKLQKKAAG